MALISAAKLDVMHTVADLALRKLPTPLIDQQRAPRDGNPGRCCLLLGLMCPKFHMMVLAVGADVPVGHRKLVAIDEMQSAGETAMRKKWWLRTPDWKTKEIKCQRGSMKRRHPKCKLQTKSTDRSDSILKNCGGSLIVGGSK
jgi:hypothetical protein